VKLKLDLHPIYSDSRQIEAALGAVIDEACEKRAAEVEIIPGKGSGALKKTVLRYLDRPDVKARFHRIEKDSDNWGRLFVHFRWEKPEPAKKEREPALPMAVASCFCCDGSVRVAYDDEAIADGVVVSADCPGCGSPNRIVLRKDRRGQVTASAESGYEQE
jgi:hypothetical protein